MEHAIEALPPISTTGSTAAEEGDEVNKEKKHGFSSRWAFWLTAIGCSVGFGNLWRFPYLVYVNGGAVFFIPYIIALILVVWPLSLLEMGLGQTTQGGNITSFASLGKRSRGVGLTGFVSFNICCYYPLLLSWSLIYLINSLYSEMPWSIPKGSQEYCNSLLDSATCELTKGICEWNSHKESCVASILYRANSFFRDGCFAHTSTTLGAEDYYNGINGVSGWNVLTMFISWVACFLALVAGQKLLGYIMYVTMTLPAVFLIILVVLGITLEGSGAGIAQYIAKFDFNSLVGSSWIQAIGQGVFSVGVAQGTMAAFSSHNQKTQNFVQDCFVVIIADTLFAFLAGFSVFTVVGYLSFQSGKGIHELPLSGPSLAFTTYPVGLSILTGVGANIFTALFFVTLWLLGMDTLVGLVESCILIVCESRFGKKWELKRWQVTLAFCCFFFLLPGLLLSTNMGFWLLDSIDHFSCNLTQTFGAGMEAVAAGWFFHSSQQRHLVGKKSYYTHTVTWFGGFVLLAALTILVGPAVGLPIGICIMLGGLVFAVYFSPNTDITGKKLTLLNRLERVTVWNTDQLRTQLSTSACQGSWFKMTLGWSLLIKYVTPVVCFFVLSLTILDPELTVLRPSATRPFPFYVTFIGVLGPLTIFLLMILFAFKYDWITSLLPPDLPSNNEPFDTSKVTAVRETRRLSSVKLFVTPPASQSFKGA